MAFLTVSHFVLPFSSLESRDQEKLRNLCENSSLSVKLELKLETLGTGAIFQTCRCLDCRIDVPWFYKKHKF